jgi:hypothetical protein
LPKHSKDLFAMCHCKFLFAKLLTIECLSGHALTSRPGFRFQLTLKVISFLILLERVRLGGAGFRCLSALLSRFLAVDNCFFVRVYCTFQVI